MKKLLLFTLLPFLGLAQVQNQTHTDCNNVTKDLYSTLASGKVVLVASKGHDCSICVNSAPGLGTFASQHTAHIEVWGAQTLTYSSSNPSCAQVNSWVSTHGWQDVFAFVDANRVWYVGGTPYYHVIDPRDTSFAYQGTNQTTARNTAMSIAATLGSSEVRAFEGKLYATSREVVIEATADVRTLRIINLAGQTILQGTPINGHLPWAIKPAPGVYLAVVSMPAGEQSVKLLVP